MPLKLSLYPLLAILALAPAPAARAAIEGRVLGPSGTPVEHARIRHAAGAASAFSDMNGRFELPGAVAPAELLISHPRFESQTVRVDAGAGPVDVVLELKQEIYEAIAVTANPGENNFSPVSVAISVLDPGRSAAPPNTLTELVAATPGVAENGQGGIFQTFSIRGVSRQRVMTLVSGMRIVGERRAGVSASFIDPLLVGSTDVLRGPSSTYYGSGALGGVVQLFPEVHEGWSVGGGYDSRGDEVHQMVGWGAGGWSLGLAHRFAGNSETAAGDELNTGFRQTSATLGHSWTRGQLELDLLAIASVGRDIQKSNVDFPERTTVYPEEGHALVRFGIRSKAGWDLAAYAHPNDLETRVSRADGRVDSVLNDAVDLGLSWQRRLQPARGTVVRVGVDYFGRRSVDARETNRALVDGAPVVTGFQRALDGGEEDEAGVFGAGEWNVGRATVLVGGRYVLQRQRNEGSAGVDDDALTGFAGVVLPLGEGIELVANVGSGLRFPSLGERFFSGTTGRGQVSANPDLGPERSLNLDAGLRWYGDRLFLAGYVFRNEIDDYIERVAAAGGELTFVNLTAGTIAGVELEGFYQLPDDWSLSFGGHAIEGRDDADRPLADIPADSVFLGARWARGRWSWDGRLEARRSKGDPGAGEKPVPSAALLASSVGYELRTGLRLSVSARNLLDESYFNSADSDVPPAAGRSFAASLSWRP